MNLEVVVPQCTLHTTSSFKGMPAELGGYHVYEGQMAMLQAWLANPHFCPTQVEALRSLQHG